MTVTPQTNATLADIAQALREHDNYIIAGHISPDGDCIGSQLALMHALRALGKRVTCVLAADMDSVGRSLRFMPGADELIPAADVESCSCFIGVDVPSRERMGEDSARLHCQAEFTVTIDHHAHPEAISTLNYVDPDAASASTIIWELAGELGIERAGDIALCAYTGLVTDTGRFQYQNADERAFRLAGEMIGSGVDISLVTNEIFARNSLSSLRLQARMLDHMELHMDGALAVSYASLEDFQATGATKPDADNLVNILRSVDGVRVACMFRETEENVRGSLRSKDKTDISAFARAHNGGGHKAASGMTLEGPLENAFTQVTSELEAYLLDAWSLSAGQEA